MSGKGLDPFVLTDYFPGNTNPRVANWIIKQIHWWSLQPVVSSETKTGDSSVMHAGTDEVPQVCKLESSSGSKAGS